MKFVFVTQLKNLEFAFEKLKHKLPKRNVEEQEANQ